MRGGRLTVIKGESNVYRSCEWQDPSRYDGGALL